MGAEYARRLAAIRPRVVEEPIPVCSFCGQRLGHSHDRMDKGCCWKCWQGEHE